MVDEAYRAVIDHPNEVAYRKKDQYDAQCINLLAKIVLLNHAATARPLRVTFSQLADQNIDSQGKKAEQY